MDERDEFFGFGGSYVLGEDSYTEQGITLRPRKKQTVWKVIIKK